MNNDEVMGRAKSVVAEALNLKYEKLCQYGTRRYEPNRYPTPVSKALLFSDIQRKFQRIEQYLVWGNGGESIKDTLLDLINYGVDGVILAEEEGWQ